MKEIKKKAAVLLSASLLFGAGSPPVLLHAEDRTKIESVTLHITAELGTDSDFSDMSLQITAGSGNYSLDDYEITNDSGSSSYPTIEVTLDADDGYYFDVSSRDVILEGEEADCTSRSTKDDKERLVLKIRLTDMTANLSAADYAELDDDGEGTWASVAGARRYEVRLYRNSSMVGSSKTTSDTEYDFSGMISRKGDYSFKVRAIGNNSSDKGEWTESNTCYFDEALDDDDWWDHPHGPAAIGPSGPGNQIYYSGNAGPGVTPSYSSGWQQDNVGWWYRNADGSYPSNTWLFVDNNWFHFDNSGYMQTGWITDGGRLYYLNPISDGTKGKMVTGWQYINGKYYYFNTVSDGTRGALITNTVVDRYYVDSDGAWVR